jgi:hypothetical protein
MLTPLEQELATAQRAIELAKSQIDTLKAQRAVLVQACEVAQALIQSFDAAHPGGFMVGLALFSLSKAIAKAKGE